MINGLYTGVTTQELDTLASEIAASMTTEHADYAVLAARISVSNLHKESKKLFSGIYRILIYYTDDSSQFLSKTPMLVPVCTQRELCSLNITNKKTL